MKALGFIWLKVMKVLGFLHDCEIFVNLHLKL